MTVEISANAVDSARLTLTTHASSVIEALAPTVPLIEHGDDQFVDQVRADLETLRHTRTGADLIQSLNDSGHTVTIEFGGNRAKSVGDGDVWYDDPFWQFWSDDSISSGADGWVGYNNESLSNSHGPRPPVVVLGHELMHADDYMNGTLRPGESEQVDINGDPVVDSRGIPNVANNREIDVVGLPYDRDAGHGEVGTVADHEENDRTVTENRLRDELGIDLRPHY